MEAGDSEVSAAAAVGSAAAELRGDGNFLILNEGLYEPPPIRVRSSLYREGKNERFSPTIFKQ